MPMSMSFLSNPLIKKQSRWKLSQGKQQHEIFINVLYSTYQPLNEIEMVHHVFTANFLLIDRSLFSLNFHNAFINFSSALILSSLKYYSHQYIFQQNAQNNKQRSNNIFVDLCNYTPFHKVLLLICLIFIICNFLNFCDFWLQNAKCSNYTYSILTVIMQIHDNSVIEQYFVDQCLYLSSVCCEQQLRLLKKFVYGNKFFLGSQ